MPDLLDTEKYEEAGPYHLNIYKNDIAFRKITNSFVDWFCQLVTDKSARILDIGSGEGLYVKRLSECGYKNVAGIDLNRIAVRYAKQNDIDVSYGNVVNFTKEADVALLIHAFEHFDNPEKAVENITRNIKKEIFIVNPLWESDYHFDNYNINKFIKLFHNDWTFALFRKQAKLEFIRLKRRTKELPIIQNECLLPYENKFYQRKALIFSPGPSLKKYQKLNNEDEFIKIGVKQAIEYRQDYDYYFFGDKNVRSRKYEDKIKAAKCTKFCLCRVDNKDKAGLYSDDEATNDFDSIPVTLLGWGGSSFALDIARVGYRQGSTTHAAINFALFCGIRDIYLVGCDSSTALSFNEDSNEESEHYKGIWESFDNYFDFNDIKYTFINPVNVLTTRNHEKICQ